MTRARRTTFAAAAVAAGAILVGAGAAIAAGEDESTDDLSALAERIRAKDDVTAAVAEKLGTSTEQLETAIEDAANDRIDVAEEAGSLSAADADTLRQAVAEGDHVAMRIAQPADVAEKLGVTEAKLDEAYAAVRKAEALARVDEAEKAGRITAEVADQMRERIEAADFSGFGTSGPGHHGGRLEGGGPGSLGPAGLDGRGHEGAGDRGHEIGPLGAPEGDDDTYHDSGSSPPAEDDTGVDDASSVVM